MPNMDSRNPMLFDWNRAECLGKLRNMELMAYHHIVKVLRSQGELTKEKRKLLTDLQNVLKVGLDRHKAEVRRVVNDEEAYTIAHMLCGNSSSQTAWAIEARRLIPLIPRATPEVAYTAYATRMSQKYFKMNCEKPKPSDTANFFPDDDLGRTSDYTDSEGETDGLRYLDDDMVPEKYCTKGTTYNKLTQKESSSAVNSKSKKTRTNQSDDSKAPSDLQLNTSDGSSSCLKQKRKRKRSRSLETLVPQAVPMIVPQSPGNVHDSCEQFSVEIDGTVPSGAHTSERDFSALNAALDYQAQQNENMNQPTSNINRSGQSTAAVKQNTGSTSISPPQKVILISTSVAGGEYYAPPAVVQTSHSRQLGVLKNGALVKSTSSGLSTRTLPPTAPSRPAATPAILSQSSSASSFLGSGAIPRVRDTASPYPGVRMTTGSSGLVQKTSGGSKLVGAPVRHSRPQIIMQQDSHKAQSYDQTSPPAILLGTSLPAGLTPVQHANVQVRSSDLLTTRSVPAPPRGSLSTAPVSGVIVATQHNSSSLTTCSTGGGSIGPVYVMTNSNSGSGITVVTRTIAPQQSAPSMPQRVLAINSVNPAATRTSTTAIMPPGSSKSLGPIGYGSGNLKTVTTNRTASGGGASSAGILGGVSGTTPLRSSNHSTGTSNLRNTPHIRGISRGGIRSTVQTVRVAPGSVRSVSSSGGKSNVIVMHKGSPAPALQGTSRHPSVVTTSKITIGKNAAATHPKALSGGGTILRTTAAGGATNPPVLKTSLTIPPSKGVPTPGTSFHRITTVPSLKSQGLASQKDGVRQTGTVSSDSAEPFEAPYVKSRSKSTNDVIAPILKQFSTVRTSSTERGCEQVQVVTQPPERMILASVVHDTETHPRTLVRAKSHCESMAEESSSTAHRAHFTDINLVSSWKVLDHSPEEDLASISVQDVSTGDPQLPEGQAQVLEEAMQVFCSGDEENAKRLLQEAGLTLIESSSDAAEELVASTNPLPPLEESMGSSRIRVEQQSAGIEVSSVSDFIFTSETTTEALSPKEDTDDQDTALDL